MKILKKIGIGLLAVILLLVIISFFLPSKVHVERTTEIKAQPEVVFGLVNNLHNWEQWSPWHQIDTAMKITYSDIAEGQGAWYNWTSDHKQVGNGKLTIVESTPPAMIRTQLNFGDMSPSFASFIFEPANDGVKLTWTMDADMGMNPIGKFFGLMMDKMIGPDYEKGLANLKTAAEQVPVKETIAGFEFEERNIGRMMVMGIREKVAIATLSNMNFANWYGTISKSVAKQQLKFAGAPLAVYYSYDSVNTEVEAAIPVDGEGKNDGTVKFHEMPACRAIVVKYMGNYNGVAPVYNAAFAHIASKGMTSSGPPMEMYITDPATEPDTSKWLTEIVFPVQ